MKKLVLVCFAALMMLGAVSILHNAKTIAEQQPPGAASITTIH